MQITRRSFINSLSAATALTAAFGSLTAVFPQEKSLGELFPLPPEVYSEAIYSMTAKQFKGFIGHSFTVSDRSGRSVKLVLTEVNILERSGNTLRGYYGECYSLIFEGRQRQAFAQDTYTFEADSLGRFDALVVPTGNAQRQYEVIVNRLTR